MNTLLVLNELTFTLCVSFWKFIIIEAISQRRPQKYRNIPWKKSVKESLLVQKLYEKKFIYLKKYSLRDVFSTVLRNQRNCALPNVHLHDFLAPGKFLVENDRNDVLLWTISLSTHWNSFWSLSLLFICCC